MHQGCLYVSSRPPRLERDKLLKMARCDVKESSHGVDFELGGAWMAEYLLRGKSPGRGYIISHALSEIFALCFECCLVILLCSSIVLEGKERC